MVVALCNGPEHSAHVAGDLAFKSCVSIGSSFSRLTLFSAACATRVQCMTIKKGLFTVGEG